MVQNYELSKNTYIMNTRLIPKRKVSRRIRSKKSISYMTISVQHTIKTYFSLLEIVHTRILNYIICYKNINNAPQAKGLFCHFQDINVSISRILVFAGTSIKKIKILITCQPNFLDVRT